VKCWKLKTCIECVYILIAVLFVPLLLSLVVGPAVHSSFHPRRDALAAVARPAWMPARPAWMPLPPSPSMQPRSKTLASPHGDNTFASPTVTLVSYAKNAKRANYEQTLDYFGRTHASVGFRDAVLWNDEAFIKFLPGILEQHPLGRQFQNQTGFGRRPYCAAFKSVMLWYAMTKPNASDYVMWIDAGYDPTEKISGNVHQLVQRLNRQQDIRSLYGQAHCGMKPGQRYMTNRNNKTNCINKNVAKDLREIVQGRWEDRIHVLNAIIVLENTLFNRLLVWDWLSIYLAKPSAFCGTHVEDQASFTLLVQNRSLPIPNFCAHVWGKKGSYRPTKNHNWFIQHAQDGRHEILWPEDYSRSSIVVGTKIVNKK